MGYFAPGLFWGTGFLGGFTTFSAYAVFSLTRPVYLTVTLVTCIGAWAVGWAARSSQERKP